jgi:hypothetical protein
LISVTINSQVYFRSEPHGGRGRAGRLPRSINFAHVAVMHDCHMMIVPGDRDSVPTRFNDLAAIIGFALPTDAVAGLKGFRFGGSHLSPLNLPNSDLLVGLCLLRLSGLRLLRLSGLGFFIESTHSK